MLQLEVRDSFGNITNIPLTIEVYAPTPSITTYASGLSLTGVLDERIAKEPVDLFRVRPGGGITRITSSPTRTVDSGQYQYAQSVAAKPTIVLNTSGSQMFIDAQSGLPIGNGLTLSVE